MHAANKAFWEYCADKYPEFFGEGKRVIEYGSYDINGSIRPILKSEVYVGVDWRPGPSVDLVCLAHEVKIDEGFDAVVSASMLEHDPFWEKSLQNMVEALKPHGIIILSWGAALNPQHCLSEAPDGNFHALKAGSVLNKLKELGVSVYEFWYESNLERITGVSGGDGEVCLVAFLQQRNQQPWHIDELKAEDRILPEIAG